MTRLSPDSSVSSVRQFSFVQRCERRAIIVFTGPEQCVILEYFELLWHECLHTHVRLSIVLFSEKQWSSRPPTSFYEATEERQKTWFLSPWKRTEQVSSNNKPFWMYSLYFVFFTQIKHYVWQKPQIIYIQQTRWMTIQAKGHKVSTLAPLFVLFGFNARYSSR